MKQWKSLNLYGVGLIAVFLLALTGCDREIMGPVQNEKSLSTSGFDEFGYNDVAGIFNGLADGLDRNLDGTYYGDPTYALDQIVMKWNKDWQRGNDEGWANPPYSAWINNEWNGMNGGSGETWHYNIVWSQLCTDGGTPTDGGYCIWNQFEVLLSHGTADAHFWDVHAVPTGYGVAR